MKKLFLLFLLPLLAFTSAHKFYVSVTNINYDEAEDALQITTRIFIDDMEQVLEERYDIDGELATDEESKLADMYIEKYLRAKFLIRLDGEPVNYNFLGKRYDNDVMICYLEVENANFSAHKKMSVQSEVLNDLFTEQKNIVNIKWKGNKKSFVLIRENNKGLLNL